MDMSSALLCWAAASACRLLVSTAADHEAHLLLVQAVCQTVQAQMHEATYLMVSSKLFW
jgi:hypothetical protein